MNFADMIRKDLQDEANEQRLKISIVLTGDPARAFQALHHSLNQEQEISCGQLAARLLGLALVNQEEPRRRRSRLADMQADPLLESLS